MSRLQDIAIRVESIPRAAAAVPGACGGATHGADSRSPGARDHGSTHGAESRAPGASPGAGAGGPGAGGTGLREVTGGLGGGVAAILSELATLLELLAQSGSAAAIDLRSLPMSPADRIELERALGEGEVQATLNAQGVSKIRETRIPGLWWVEHFDPHGALIAEMIEVSRVPDILARAPDEISAAAEALRTELAGVAAETSPALPVGVAAETLRTGLAGSAAETLPTLPVGVAAGTLRTELAGAAAATQPTEFAGAAAAAQPTEFAGAMSAPMRDFSNAART